MLLGSVYPAVGSCLLIIVGITLLKISIIPVYSQLNISPGYKCEDVSFFLNRVRISIFLMSWATPQSSHVPPATAGEPPWSVSTPGWESLVYKYISEYRLRVRMCLLCLIYHLASALTMLLSGWVGALCVCVLPGPTDRPGLTEQIAWPLKRCWGLWCSLAHPPSLHQPTQWSSADAQVQ